MACRPTIRRARPRVVDAMTVEQIQALAAQYLAPDRMTYVVVGDAATQA